MHLGGYWPGAARRRARGRGWSATGIEAKKVEKPKDIQKLNLRPQRDAPEDTEYLSVSDITRKVVLTTLVTETYYPLSDVVADVRRRMKVHDDMTGGDLMKTYPKKRIEGLIRDALKRLKVKGTAVSQENRQLIMSAFGSLRQKSTRAGAVWAQEPDGVESVTTSAMGPVRERISGLTAHVGLFHDELSPQLGSPDDAAALKKAKDVEVPTFMRQVDNSYLLKSPVNVVLTSYKPERFFVERLLKADNAAALKAWVKTPDVGFYGIEYGYQPGGNGRSKRGMFNPDFFLLREGSDEVVVVETKDDGDVSDVNSGKLATLPPARQPLPGPPTRLRSQPSTRGATPGALHRRQVLAVGTGGELRKLCARVDPELGEDVTEVVLDRLARHEPRLRDLRIRHPRGGHLGHPPL